MSLFDNEYEMINGYQILLVPNITYLEDIDKDSYVKFMSDIIRELNKIRDDLFWHAVLPTASVLLDFPNVKQYHGLKIQSYPNSMRGDFHYQDWLNILDWKGQHFDLIWSHLPEWTTNIDNLVHNVTNHGGTPIMGYCHWTETPEFAKYDRTYLMNNLTGMLPMKVCGYNTQHQINNILTIAQQYFSLPVMNKLQKIMQPMLIGINDAEIQEEPSDQYGKVIVFNHRTQQYRGWTTFLEAIKLLRADQQDFSVWASLADPSGMQQAKEILEDTSFINTTPADSRADYLNQLRHSCVGVLCGNRWSISVLDGLSQGLPYIHEPVPEMDELFGHNKFEANSTNQLYLMLKKCLKDNKHRMMRAHKAIQVAKESSWGSRIQIINDHIQASINTGRVSSERSEKREELVEAVRHHKKVTKSLLTVKMGWGRGISFTSYRNYLREHPQITMTFDGMHEFFEWRE
jgi:hypothetical protein